eukprot:CAMPEP_0182434168 /NCGR_PEP_ID=MMETSP1167-20130531/68151_1 /TAXON_ID=2988 /ORGANISM="Mallomonas Sp, Strain CCMP3275" /LENGTH=355 /DNA_ID=CAMNT_0024623729 /DNA_START=125 /DNA_END=1192 /DNA_ORIENTATION=-
MSSKGDHASKICVLGGGAWGTTIAAKVANNILNDDSYDRMVKMWVYEEIIDGRNLTDCINEDHINSKYIPFKIIPSNIHAYSDIGEAVHEADIILFVIPRKFIPTILTQLKGHIKKSAIGLSLIKGLDFIDGKPQFISEMIQNELDLAHIAVLMGANVASDVMNGEFVESTLACTDPQVQIQLQRLLEGSSFAVEICGDVCGVELCGALKNVVALGAGFCDALQYGSSSKAAVLRKGLQEMKDLCKLLLPTFQEETILRSCGVADVIASSYGGRNRRCAFEYASRILEGYTPSTVSWKNIESDILHGAQIEGLGTCRDLFKCLVESHATNEFPLFTRIYEVAFAGAPPSSVFLWK